MSLTIASGKISLDETLKNADAANNLRLRIELDAKGKGKGSEETFDGLSLYEEPVEEEEDEANPNGPHVFINDALADKGK